MRRCTALPKTSVSKRSRRQTVEVLESRIAPAYVFTLAGSTATGTSNAQDHIVIDVSGGQLEYSVNGGAFSFDWDTTVAGVQPLLASASSVVNLNFSASDGSSLVLGSPVGPASQLLASFHVNAPANAADTLVIDDSASVAVNTYHVDMALKSITGTGISYDESAGHALGGGVTINGSHIDGNIFNVISVASSEPVTLVAGSAGTTTVNVGSGNVLNIGSPLTVYVASGGSAILNLNDQNDVSHASATLDNLSGNGNAPYQISGLSAANILYGPGVSAVNIFGGSGIGAAGVTFNINGTQSTTTTTISGGTGNNVFNLSNAGLPSGLDNLPGPVVIHGNTGNDSIILHDESADFNDSYTITSTTVSRLFFGGLTYDSAIENLTLNAENTLGTNGVNTISVTSTAAGVLTTINPDGGADTIDIGNGDLSQLHGAVVVSGGTGIDTVHLFDQNNTSTDTYTITSSTVSRPGFGGLTYDAAVAVLALDGESGGNTYNITDTHTGTTTTITGGSGDNIYNLGDAAISGGLDNLLGAVVIHGNTGLDSINLNDQNANFNDTYTITSTTVSRLVFGGLTFDGAIENLTLNAESTLGTNGNNVIDITSTAAGVLTTVNADDGNDTINVGAGDLSLLLGAVVVSGGAGTDTVHVDDHSNASANTYAITGTTVSLPGFGGLTYDSTVELLNVDGGSGGNIYNITGTSAATVTTVTGGVGNDIFNLSSAASPTGLSNLAGALVIHGGAGSDVVTLFDHDTTAADNYTITNTTVARAGFGGLTYDTVETLNVTESAGGHTFNVDGWSGSGTLTNNGTSSDTISASKSANFTLSNTGLSASDGLAATLAGTAAVPFAVAHLTDTGGGHSFTVGGWSGTGSLTDNGVNSDTVNATKSANFTLSNTDLSATDGMNLTLGGTAAIPFSVANLTDTGGGHSFTVDAWTGTGSLKNNGGGGDTVNATKSANFTLSNTELKTTDGMDLTLGGTAAVPFATANLTDTGGGHSFTVDGWTAGGALKNNGAASDTVNATKNAGFTLSNTGLSATDGMNLTLGGTAAVPFSTANLTDTGGGHVFNLNGWTQTVILTNNGAGSDTVNATDDASFTLSDTALTSSTGLNATLAGSATVPFATANLTDTGGGHSFTVDGWTGGGSLNNNGVAGDTVNATKDADFILSNTGLQTSDGMNLTLGGTAATPFSTANLTDTGGGNSFTLNGWTGNGTLDNDGAASDTLNATENASFTLSDSMLSATNGLSMTLGGTATTPFSVANLTDTGGGHSFTVDGWTGTGSLTNNGVAADTVNASKNADFTLSNTELKSGDGMDLTLGGSAAAPFSVANLTDTGGGHTFTVDGWTGTGMLTNNGVAADTVKATKSASFTLSNTELMATDGMDLILGGSAAVPFSTANLTDTGGGHSFTVDGWTHTGTLTNTGAVTDTVDATKNASFTVLEGIAGAELKSSDGMDLQLSNVGILNLSGSAIAIDGNGSGSETATWEPSAVTAFTGAIALSYITVNYDVAGTGDLSIANLYSLTLQTPAGVNAYALGNGAVSGNAELSGTSSGKGQSLDFTAVTSLTVDTATNAVAANSNSLTVNSLSDEAALQNLSVTTGAGTDTLTLNVPSLLLPTAGGFFQWTAGSGTDTLVATASVGRMTLANNGLSYGTPATPASLGTLSLPGSDVEIANLTDTGGGHSFTVDGWTGTGSLTNTGAGADTVNAAKNANFTVIEGLASTELKSTDGMDLTLFNIAGLNLSGGSIAIQGNGSGGETAIWEPSAAIAYTGSIVLASETITYAVAGAGDLSISNLAGLTLQTPAGANVYTLGSGAVSGNAELSGTSSGKSQSLDFNSVVAVTVDTATNAVSADTNSVTVNSLSGETALKNLTVTTGAGTDTLTLNVTSLTLPTAGGAFQWLAGAGTDTLVATAAVANMTLGNSGLSYGSIATPASLGTLSIPNADVEVANLTDTGGGNSFTVDGWTGTGSLTNNGTNPDTVFAAKNAGFTLSNTELKATDGMDLTLGGTAAVPFSTANLTDTGGGHSFTVDGWTGNGTLKDTGASADTLNATKSASFTVLEGASSTELKATDGMDVTLVNIATLNLSGSAIAIQGNGSGSETAVWQPSAATAYTGVIKLASETVDYAVTGLGDLSISDLAGLKLQTPAGSNAYALGNAVAAGSAQFSGTSSGMGQSLDFTSVTSVTVDTATNAVAGNNNTLTVNSLTGESALENLTFSSGSENATLSVHSISLVLPTAGGSFRWTAGSGTNVLNANAAVAGTAVAKMVLTDGSLSYHSSANASLGTLTLVGTVPTANLTGASVTGNQLFTFDVSGWDHVGSITGTGSAADNKLQSTKTVAYQKVSDNAGDATGLYLAMTDAGVQQISMTLANVGQVQLAGDNSASSTTTILPSAPSAPGAYNFVDKFGTPSPYRYGNWLDASGFHGAATLIGGDSITDTLNQNVGYDIFSAGLGTNFIYAGSQDSRFELNSAAKLTVVYSSDSKGLGDTRTGQNHNLLDFSNSTTGVHVNLARNVGYTSSTNVDPSMLGAIKAQNLLTGKGPAGATANQSEVSGFLSSVENGTVSGTKTGWLVLVGTYDDVQGSHHADVLTGNRYNNIIYGNGEDTGHDVLTGGTGRNYLIGDKLTTFGAQTGTDTRFRYKKLIDSYPNDIPSGVSKTGATVSIAPFTEPLPPAPAMMPKVALSLASVSYLAIPDVVVAAVAGLL